MSDNRMTIKFLYLTKRSSYLNTHLIIQFYFLPFVQTWCSIHHSIHTRYFIFTLSVCSPTTCQPGKLLHICPYWANSIVRLVTINSSISFSTVLSPALLGTNRKDKPSLLMTSGLCLLYLSPNLGSCLTFRINSATYHALKLLYFLWAGARFEKWYKNNQFWHHGERT